MNGAKLRTCVLRGKILSDPLANAATSFSRTDITWARLQIARPDGKWIACRPVPVCQEELEGATEVVKGLRARLFKLQTPSHFVSAIAQ